MFLEQERKMYDFERKKKLWLQLKIVIFEENILGYFFYFCSFISMKPRMKI